MPKERNEIDITGVSFDGFVLFIFDRPLPTEQAGKKHHWYYDIDVTFEPAEIAAHYIELFKNPQPLRSRFSPEELEEGFWAIQGPNLECSVFRVIWIEDLPFTTRERCVRSMFHLFERLFFDLPLDTAPHMWWDSLCYDWHCGNRDRARGGKDRTMQDVMFETLTLILGLDSIHCQSSALHGLGHLHHPDTPNLIEGYLKRNRGISADMREYALAAAEFHVL